VRVWVALGVALSLAGCAATDRELLPGDDAGGRDGGASDGGASDGGALACLSGAEDCAGCAPACEGCDRCGLVCAPRGACRVGLREPVVGTLQCDDGAACGRAASAFDYCRADQARCTVTALETGRVACLHGRCEIVCEAACEVECPSGDCTVRCLASPCDVTSCPTTWMDCAPGVFACGSACPGG